MDSYPEERALEIGRIDRLSELPDPILSKIMSYLPTKNAVATSILSTRWKNIFPFGLPPITLDIDDSLLLHPEENEPESCSSSFMDFVDKLLYETLRDVPCVDTLILKCEKHYGDGKFISWICAALRLNVRWLQLELFLDDSETLFHRLDGCTTLTRLQLTGKLMLYIPINFSLPTLKNLDLLNIIFGNVYDDYEDETELGTMMRLINGCPALEELSLTDCDLQDLNCINIKSPLLKTLIIENSLDISCELTIDTPNLVLLLLNDCVASDYIISSFNSLQAAHIDVGPSQLQLDEYDRTYDDEEQPWFYDVVGHLVYDCRNTRHLYLATCSIECLHHANGLLPPFQNLTWLSLGCVYGSHGWALLAGLLCSAPCLEKLTLEGGFKECKDGYSNFESAVSATPLLCLELQLKEIEIWEFNEQEDEIKLIEYFLKNGKVLHTLKLYCRLLMGTSIRQRLHLLPETLKILVEVK